MPRANHSARPALRQSLSTACWSITSLPSPSLALLWSQPPFPELSAPCRVTRPLTCLASRTSECFGSHATRIALLSLQHFITHALASNDMYYGAIFLECTATGAHEPLHLAQKHRCRIPYRRRSQALLRSSCFLCFVFAHACYAGKVIRAWSRRA